MTYLSSPYSGDADLAGIVELIDACEEVDHLHDSTSVEELRVDFSFPQADPTRNARLWKDEQGRVIGYVRLWFFEPGETLDARLIDLKVRQEARGAALEAQMLQWAEQRVQEGGKEHGLAGELQTRTRDDQTELIELIKARGYTLERYFWTMDRALTEPDGGDGGGRTVCGNV
jgi:GNAT superfamily N-acetyltransferase